MSQCKRCAIDEELSKGYCTGCWSEMSGYKQALADVRREINDRWGAASFSSYRARVLEVLDQLEQRGTTTTEKNDGPPRR